MYSVYAISSLSKKYIYVGQSIDVDKRVARHNAGKEKTTRAYKPFKLIFVETVSGDRKDARLREKYWKSGVGREKLRQIRDKKI